RKPSPFGFKKKPERVEILELLARPLRRGAVADEVLLANEPLALKPAQSLSNRRLRYAEITCEDINRDTRPRRDLKRHEAVVDNVIDAINNTAGPADALSCVPLRYCHFCLRSHHVEICCIRGILCQIKYRIRFHIRFFDVPCRCVRTRSPLCAPQDGAWRRREERGNESVRH